MAISQIGLALIKRYEGLRLKAYPDPASGGDPWTIGYGHTKGVKAGDVITQAQADAFLLEDAAEAEAVVSRLVTVGITQSQRDALVSFVFNLGARNFEESTLLKKLNADDYDGAAAEFARWNKAAGKVMPGLIARRESERVLFTAPAPVESREIKESPTVSPFLIPAIQAISEYVPALIKAVGGGSEMSERNAKAAQIAVDAAKEAIGATNEQQLVEQLQTGDPVVVAAVQDGVKAVWHEITEVGGGVVEARKADAAFVASGAKLWQSPALLISVLLLVMPFMLLADVFYVHPVGYDANLRTQIVTAVLMVIGMVGAFWLGTSYGSQRKTDLLGSK